VACVRYLVSGRVQGVFFRVSARDQARTLGLSGEVQNLPDGRVLVIACGSQQALDSLQQWLWQGPPQAAVTGVLCEADDDAGYKGFDIA